MMKKLKHFSCEVKIKNNILKEIVYGYFWETVYDTCIDFLIIAFFVIVSAFFIDDVKFYFYVMAIFLIPGLIVYFLLCNYTSILLFFDLRKNEQIKIQGKILEHKEEFSFSGPQGHSRIKSLYPKELDMTRVKIKVLLPDGKTEKVRTIMSYKKRHDIFSKDEVRENDVELIYYKRSKVLCSMSTKNSKENILIKRL